MFDHWENIIRYGLFILLTLGGLWGIAVLFGIPLIQIIKVLRKEITTSPGVLSLLCLALFCYFLFDPKPFLQLIRLFTPSENGSPTQSSDIIQLTLIWATLIAFLGNLVVIAISFRKR